MGKKPNATLQTHWSSIYIRIIVCVCVFLRQNERRQRGKIQWETNILCAWVKVRVYLTRRGFVGTGGDHKLHFQIKCKLNRTGQRRLISMVSWSFEIVHVLSFRPDVRCYSFLENMLKAWMRLHSVFHKKRPKLDSDHGSHDTNSVFRGGRCSEHFLFYFYTCLRS